MTWFMSEEKIMDVFWTEFAGFRNRQGAFGVAAWWKGCHTGIVKVQLGSLSSVVLFWLKFCKIGLGLRPNIKVL